MSKAPLLFPLPREYAELESPGASSHAPVTTILDGELPEQGYRITTSSESISIVYGDAAGLRYALQTIDQLRATGTLERVAVKITDWPDFPVRGFMLDVTRDRVPTRRTLKRYVELLALARINQLELYMEHAFAYQGHEQVWSNASPLTAEDMRWLDDLCAGVGIELVANQNTFGHMWRWLELDAYADRAEKPGGFGIFGAHHVASTLRPTQENVEFVEQLLQELTSTLRSRRLNIGADEPFELGRGRSQDEVKSRGAGNVYFDHVTKVMQPWLEKGYLVEFWADIFGNFPELMDAVPAGAMPVVWQYDSPSLTRDVWANATPQQHQHWKSVHLDMEALQEGFAARAKAFIDAGTTFWVAPGTSTWQSFVGRIDNALENMIDAAEVGLRYGSGGYITTLWGDHGHFDPPAVSFGPVVFGGAISWCVETNRDVDLASVLNRYVFDDETSVLGGVLMGIASTTQMLGAPLLNSSPLFVALLHGGTVDGFPAVSPKALDSVDSVFSAALDDLDIAKPSSGDGDVAIREVRQAIRFARIGVEVIRKGGVAKMAPAEASRLLSVLDAVLVEQRATWLLRSRPGGLDDSLERMTAFRKALVVRASASITDDGDTGSRS